jgi:L-asparaginase/Glu-tRNA(Gln) amidotransferase subunit D
VSVKYKKSGLSDGAIAGMVIGSVTCAAILVGAAVYMTKMNNKTVDTFESIENIQVNFVVAEREGDGWMLTKRAREIAKELMDTAPEEIEFW